MLPGGAPGPARQSVRWPLPFVSPHSAVALARIPSSCCTRRFHHLWNRRPAAAASPSSTAAPTVSSPTRCWIHLRAARRLRRRVRRPRCRDCRGASTPIFEPHQNRADVAPRRCPRSCFSGCRPPRPALLLQPILPYLMDESRRPMRRRRHAWRPLFPSIGLPLPADRPGRVSRVHRPQYGSGRNIRVLPPQDGSSLHPSRMRVPREMPRPLPVGSLIREDSSVDFSRFKLLSVDDLVPTEEAATHCDEEIVREGATATHEHGSDDASDDDEDIGDPFLVDEFGNLTQWKLSDLNKQFGKHLDDELNEPKTKEKKQSKQDMLKWHNDRMELYMKSSIKKYNQEKNLDEGFCFEFVKVLKESFIVEGGCKFYRHFNFEAMQSGTSISLFFAEVIPDGENCEVTCCKLLEDDDNGRCLGCNNQGHSDLMHPASGNVYVGGRENCMFPFLIDSDSEDDSSLREELISYGRS